MELLSQKDAVHQYVVALKGEIDCPKLEFNRDLKLIIRLKLFHGIRAKEVYCGGKPKDDSALLDYCYTVVSLWFKKDPRYLELK